LKRCYKENPAFQIDPLTIKRSLKSLGFRLWDESTKKMVGFSVLKQSN
jgi:hypothetical protein